MSSVKLSAIQKWIPDMQCMMFCRLTDRLQQIVMFGPKVKASYREFLPPQLRPDVNKQEEDFENFFPSARKMPDVTSSNITYFSPARTFEVQKLGLFTSGRQGSATDEGTASTQPEKRQEEIVFSEVDSAGWVFNYSLFYTLHEDFLIGFEILIYYDVTGRFSYFAIYPQFHWHFSMELQVGPGLVFTKEKIIPKFAHRLIVETLPNNES